jgi:C1A family cysteine protease
VPMPGHHEQVFGGHAVLVVGYDDSQSRFIVRNSWGTQWGLHGYFLMPYAYLTNRRLASDFWSANRTE